MTHPIHKWQYNTDDLTNACYFKKDGIKLTFEDASDPSAPAQEWEAGYHIKLPPKDGKWVWTQRDPVVSVV